MKAAYLVKPGTIEVREVPEPVPGPGEVVIRVEAALTCGTDLKAFMRGHSLIPMPGPFGHEFSGTVFRTGEGVKKFSEGDEVMTVHSAPCNACGYCRRGLENLCVDIMKDKVMGAYAEYILVSRPVVEQNMYHKPPDLSFGEAAMLEPLACVVHPYAGKMIDENGWALVIGAGPIGLLHLLVLKGMGAGVIVCDMNDSRLDMATGMGADLTASPAAVEDAVSAATGAMGVDMAVECTGMPEVWERAPAYVRRGGTVILFGGCRAGTSATFDTHRLHYDEISMHGSFHFTPRDVHRAYNMLKSKEIDASSLITGRAGLDEIAAVFGRLAEGRGLKYVIEP